MPRLVAAVSLVLALACAAPDGLHGHDHADEPEDPRPGLSFTVYDAGLELFMEAPAFVVGQPSPLIAHFTDTRSAEGFVWVTSGQVEAALRYADGHRESFSVDHLLRNGIFKPIVTPTRAGEAELVLALTGDVAGSVSVGTVTVHSSVDAAVAAGGGAEPTEPTVGYLKESQWKTVYATTAAERTAIRGSVRATGEIVAPLGARAAMDSPVAGRVDAGPALRVGMEVRAGDLLARVVPLGSEDRGAVEADLAEAEAQLRLADAAAHRAESLHPAVTSARDVESARATAAIARQRVDSLQARRRAWGGGTSQGAEIRSPISGKVAFVHAEPGQVVDLGAPVVEVVDAGRLWLEARVFAIDAARVQHTPGAMFQVAGRVEPVVVDASTGGHVVAIGPAVDPVDRTVPLLFEFPNPGDLLPGTFVDARVYTAEIEDAVVIPASSVVDDGGFPVVFVMDGGETFFKRRVAVGARDGARVEVLSGVQAGERVVSRGAYEVLLSTSAGGIPAHGHAH